ncbi:SRPBCC domain-containing protein [Agrococcus sp. SGAir0287]|uniref:SRPBCC domain-containing protein n=1 Tax=Agrococcus sp. SGAir0287 TaxID=2070347 RepID=UPI0010CD59FD|nr:SRPBCC domain-containing protein [Agrococcus sp. SGAir0287]QCR19834.1 polyketide cyclase [Agrococcus sp. SGAir0287]
MTSTTHERVGEQSIVHRRTFDGSVEDLHRVHTTADLFVRWMGPRGSRVRIDRFDAVTGGAFDYTVEVGEGRYRFWGAYHEVLPTRIVHTWQFDGEHDVTLEILELAETADGRCELTITSTYATREACDRMVESGLDEGGMDSDFERIDELLAQLA